MNNLFYDKKNNFLCYQPTKEDIFLAEERFYSHFSESNSVNKRTVYDRKESRLAGILGEIVYGKYLGNRGVYVGDGNVPFDFVINGKSKKINVDVKCKFRKVPPNYDFEASFFNYQSNKIFSSVDYYVFLSTITDYKYVWFCGAMSKENWLNNPHGKLWKAGDIDSSNNKIFKEDTWSVPYRYLLHFPNKSTLRRKL